jgi:threonine/homoserine/homoserine lactone efflux protein
MSSAELAALLVFCLAMCFSPGPNTTLSTALAANLGLRKALVFCFAVPAGWVLLMLCCGLGLSTIVMSVPELRWGVKAFGVAYMLWLAWKLASASTLTHIAASRLNVTFLQGVGLQFLNIKAWMLALTLTAGWVVNAGGKPSSNAGERLVMVCILMSVLIFSSTFTYALAGSLLRKWLSHGDRLLWFNRVMATLLVATAVWMLTA